MAIVTARSAVGGRCAFLGEYGVVATQGMVNTRLGYEVGQLMRAGARPDEALRRALADDDKGDIRQVLALSPDGTSACWSGRKLPGWAGHVARHGLVTAGNTLLSEATLDAMAATIGESRGSLARRLVAAVTAGQAAGGDRRGRQSACLLVGRGEPWPSVDLRVDDHPEPATELERLLALWEAEWGTYDETGGFPPARPPTHYRLPGR